MRNAIFIRYLTIFISIITLPYIKEVHADPSSCACPNVSIVCATQTQLDAACGSGSAGCSKDASSLTNPCTMWIKDVDCSRLGLSTTSSPISTSLLTMNCPDYIVPSSSAPQQDLEIARGCCTLQHELVHISDSLCNYTGLPQNVPCLESPAYEVSQTCLSDVANAFCSNFADDSPALAASCLDICQGQLQELETEFHATCYCEQSQDGVTSEEVANANCHEKCKTELSPDDLPVECQSVIANNLPEETSSTSELLDEFCDSYSSSSSSSSESSSEESSSSYSSSSESSSEESSSSSSSSSESSSEESSSSESFSSDMGSYF